MYNPAFATTTSTGAPYTEFSSDNLRAIPARDLFTEKTTEEIEIDYQQGVLGLLLEGKYSLLSYHVAKKFPMSTEVLFGQEGNTKSIKVAGRIFYNKGKKILSKKG